MHKNCKKVFSFNEFCTMFSAEGDDHIGYGRRACFDMLVSRHRQRNFRRLKINDKTTNTYEVFVSFVDIGNNFNNCCFLSKEELNEWIKDMQRFATFDYTIEDFTKGCDPNLPNLDTGDAVYVRLTFIERPFAEHFLVLEMIKHAYEYGFSWSVYQAVKLRDIINKDELFINIHNLIFCCNYDLTRRSCGDHTLLTYVYYNLSNLKTMRDHAICYFPTAEDIKRRIPLTYSISNIFSPLFIDDEDLGKDAPLKLLQLYNDYNEYDIYESDVHVQTAFKITQEIEYVKITKTDALRSLEEYFVPEECKKRLDCYINTYEKLKKYGKQQSQC